MPSLSLIRYYDPAHGAQVGLQRGEQIANISAHFPLVSGWLERSVGRVQEAIAALTWLADSADETFESTRLDHAPAPDVAHWLPPIDEQDVWAAGVTYEKSREARQEEAVDGGDIYARVYDAARPELFFKARARDVVGHLDTVGIRRDADWSVPEPELALVLNGALEPVGFTIGNDMSSRDIEGANPLYLPQAKVYRRSCALGTGILLAPAERWIDATITIAITRAGEPVFTGETHTARLKRSLPELVEYLGRCNDFPFGAVLLTGTGVVPPGDFTLLEGDTVQISIDGVGMLQNNVVTV